MRPAPILATAVVFAAVLASGAPAQAQFARGLFRGNRMFNGAGGPVSLTPGNGSVSSVPAQATILPYSYYGVPSTSPARIYVGPSEFPFYGQPYGRPSDRWNWRYLSNEGNSGLARYYHPPLG